MHFTPLLRSLAPLLLSLVALSSCSTYKRDFKPLTAPDAAKIAPYAMMAANAYHRKCEWFPLAKLGWVQIDRNERPTNEATYSHTFSLAYDVFRNDRRREYVFVYRGTDSVLDFLWANLAAFVSLEYKKADEYFTEFRENRQFKKYKIVLAGHSLGAGLALHQSVSGYDAFLFDPSPRIFGPPAREYSPHQRVVVFEKGEILTILRNRTSLWYSAATGGVYEESSGFGPNVDQKRGLAKAVALHDMFTLAENIRLKGSQANSRLIAAKLFHSPDPKCREKVAAVGPHH